MDDKIIMVARRDVILSARCIDNPDDALEFDNSKDIEQLEFELCVTRQTVMLKESSSWKGRERRWT